MGKSILIEKVVYDCPFCDKKHLLEKRIKKNKVEIKEEKIEYDEVYFLCPETDEEENEFVSAKMMDENLLKARDNYRERHNLLTSKEIKEIREKYKLTQAEFSFLLGLGEVTVTRYETKLIQDTTYDKLMRLVNDNAMIALEYLEANKEKFKNEERYAIIENNIKKVIIKNTFEYLNIQEIEAKYVDYEKECIENGYQVLDIEKLKELIYYISSKCGKLYKVKLMKMLWYIDNIYFKEYNKSLSGLVYTHQKMGALPIAYDELLKLSSVKVEEEVNEYNGDYYIGYHIIPNETYKSKNILTTKEKNICDEVIKKFNNFTTKDIVEYMHKEKAYIDTKSNDIIDFSYAQFIKL